MKLFPDKFPDNIPYLLSVFIGINFGIFLFTILIAEMIIGRPSSTHVIGFLFVPIHTGILMLICFAVGSVLRIALDKFIQSKTISGRASKLLYLAFIVTILVSISAGWLIAMWQEKKQSPHVIYSSGQIIKESGIPIEGHEVNASFVFSIFEDEKNQVKAVIKDGSNMKIDSEENIIRVYNENGKLMTKTDYDYVTRLYSVPFELDKHGPDGLAILAVLRGTAHRSIILIYDKNYHLTYQELLEDCKAEPTMKVITNNEQQKEILLIDTCMPYNYFTETNQ
jgi:hypothetical protein